MTRTFALLLFVFGGLLSAQTITDPNFTIDYLAWPGYGTIGLDFDASGRLYVAEKRGRVLVMTPDGSGGYNAPTTFADLTAFVDYSQESGLLGMVLDPDFATNRYMYLLYTTPTDQRLMRIQADATFLVWTSAQTQLLTGLPRTATYHKAGDIGFHPTDPNNIYVSLGDDGDIGGAGNIDLYEGKVLRLNKTNGEGLTTNPFYNGNTTSVRSRVWASGFRNAFRFAFHPNATADYMYMSENGGPANMTTTLQDRITWVETGADGAWNWSSYNAGDAADFFSPPPVGGQNCVVLGRDTASLIGIAIADGGVFSDPANPTSSTILVSNWLNGGGSISRWRLTGTDLDSMTPIAADGGQRFVTGMHATDMRIGPDGWLYFTHSNGDESVGGWYSIGRIRRVTGTPPVASFTPSATSGAAPLNVSFTDTSTDADGTVVSWGWDFGDGAVSTAQHPNHTFTSPGSYAVTLTVQDNAGLTHAANTTVNVYQTTSLTLTGQVFDGRDLAGSGLPVATELRLYQTDGVTPLAFAGGLGTWQNGIAVAAGGTFNATMTVQIAGGSVVVSAGEPVGDGVQAQYTGFTAGGASHTKNLTFYLSGTAFWGRITDTTGNPVQVDVGVARGAANNLYALAGGRDYLAGSGIAASGVNHRIETDELGWYYVPVRTGDQNANFYFDAVADTGAATYAAQVWIEWAFASAATRRDIGLSLLAGGAGADDLTGITVTPNVDYDTQIQPIFTAQCAGCHAATGGSAGLSLASANSWASIVNVGSSQASGLMLVQPGNAAQSYLFQKINEATPQAGIRMRPGSAMSLAQQALIRDWINQGALASGGGTPEPGPSGSGDSSDDSGGCAAETGSELPLAVLAMLLAVGTIVLISFNLRRAN